MLELDEKPWTDEYRLEIQADLEGGFIDHGELLEAMQSLVNTIMQKRSTDKRLANKKLDELKAQLEGGKNVKPAKKVKK